MLSDARVHAALPATDLERARRFYADKLGLTPAEENPGGLFFNGADGTRFLVFPSQGKASGQHTQIGFLVRDIAAEVADLKTRGVVFEEYDLPDFKTIGGIAEVGPSRAAWFKDSEGNLIGIVEMSG